MALPLNPPATLTGVGSMPGTDVVALAGRVADQLPDLPHIPELPDRGPGADMIGRTLGLLSDVSPDFAATTSVTGWELSAPGRDMRRARSWLAQDLDAVQEVWSGHRGLAKQQLAGPYTLAASVDFRGRRLLADRGLVRELEGAWQQMVAEHRLELTRRLACTWLIQMDEPLLPAVIAGSISTVSGMGMYPAVDPDLNLGADLLHCCAAGVPWAKLANLQGVMFDLSLQTLADDEPLAQLSTTGTTIGFGVSPTGGSVRNVLEFFERTGLPPAPMLITPPCGMVAEYTPWFTVVESLNERLG